MNNPTNIPLETVEQRISYLRQISKAVSIHVEAGKYANINQAVIALYYKDAVDEEFKTFHQWKAEGYSIKKGSKAFVIWGRPKSVLDAEQAKQQGKDEPAADDSTSNFYPIALLFSNAQVEKKGAQNV